MSRPKADAPAYRYHISGQAVVTFNGRNFYLGEHDSIESKAKYFALLGKYLANGKTLPDDVDDHQAGAPITVRAVTAEYREHIKTRYVNNYTETNRLQNLCSTLEVEFGDTPAVEFGPVKLGELRDLFIASGNCRTYVNRLIRQTKKIFKHAVSRELIAVEVVIRLDTLEALKKGQTTAKESKPVQPVELSVVSATAKHMSPVIKAMVQLQAATGMRPSEVCNLRPIDVEKRFDGVWLYRPAKHKTEHHGKTRVVPIVGDVRITLGPFLNRDPETFCFSPRESMTWTREQRTANRKTPDGPGRNKPGTNRKANPKRQPGEKYRPESYYRAVKSAAVKAKVPHWFPYQLRHMAATAVREALGIEAAQALLGHSHMSMTQHYAKLSEQKAIDAAVAGPSVQ